MIDFDEEAPVLLIPDDEVIVVPEPDPPPEVVPGSLNDRSPANPDACPICKGTGQGIDHARGKPIPCEVCGGDGVFERGTL